MARYGHRVQPTRKRRRGYARASRAITTAPPDDTYEEVTTVSTSLTGLASLYPPKLFERWAARTLQGALVWKKYDSDDSEWDVIDNSAYFESPYTRYRRKGVVAAFIAFVRRVHRQCPSVYARWWSGEARPSSVRAIFKHGSAPMLLRVVKLFLRYLCERRRREMEQGKVHSSRDYTWELKQYGVTLLKWQARRTRNPTPPGHVRKIKDYAIITLKSEYFERLPPPRIPDGGLDLEAIDRLSPPRDEGYQLFEAQMRANSEENQRIRAELQRIMQERRDQGMDESDPEEDESRRNRRCSFDDYIDVDLGSELED